MSEPDAEGDGPDDEGAADLEEIAGAPDDDDVDVDAALDAVLSEVDVTPEVVEPDAALVERVEDTDAAAVAAELTVLGERVADLEAKLAEREGEVDDLESRLARKQADFQNYKQRQEERLEDEKARATENLVTRLLDVRDNLARALDQDEDVDIRPGVESTLRQLDEEFERENVGRIEPEPGDDTDPQRHEVLMRVGSDRPEGAVVDVHRSGYEMAGKVLQPAQVTVSEGTTTGEDTPSSHAESDEEDGANDEPGGDEDPSA